jgi:DNA polymerase-3 subunit alpha
MSNFVHLHAHSLFSALDGVATPEEYFEECHNREYPAQALTEHGNMASVPDAYENSQKFGVKFIAGCELYYNDHEQKRRELENKGIKSKDIEDQVNKERIYRNRHLTVLCKNTDGYRNLLSLKKESYDYLFFKPRTSIKLLNKYKDNLIVLSGCMNGPVSFELRKWRETGDEKCYENAKLLISIYKKVFGDDYYIELQMPGVPNDDKLFLDLFELSKEFDIKTVLTNDAHYITEQDYNLQRIMMSIDQDVPFDSPELFISKSTSGYMKTRDQLRETFLNGHLIDGEYTSSYNTGGITLKDFEIACDRTLEIADKCQELQPDRSTKLPTFKNEKDILWKLVCKGMIEKNVGHKKEYKDRVKFEMERIIEKDFCSYFLICRDLVRKSTVGLGMPVGPRGSAGGSLVCYLIGIHEIDPMEWDLSFDRFLSSSRGGKMLRVNMDNDCACCG